MMHRSLSYAVLALMGVLLAFPVAASATAQAVLKDFAPDGVIDGKFSLKELQAADKLITPQEREYQFWDDAYAAAVDRLSNPKAVLPAPNAPPMDSNSNGSFDDFEITAARSQTNKLREDRDLPPITWNEDDSSDDSDSGSTGSLPGSFDDSDGGDFGSGGSGSDTGTGDDAKLDSSNSGSAVEDDGVNPWLLVLLAIPLAVIGFGTWRMQQMRRRRDAVLSGMPPAPRRGLLGRLGRLGSKRAARKAGSHDDFGDDFGGGPSTYAR